ncbi:hypothetical protein V1505DRAFT_365688 [Lipomyces doorenjongii]
MVVLLFFSTCGISVAIGPGFCSSDNRSRRTLGHNQLWLATSGNQSDEPCGLYEDYGRLEMPEECDTSFVI